MTTANEGRTPRPCGCAEPASYTVAQLPEPSESYALRQRERQRDKRMRYGVLALYYAAVVVVPASVTDALLVGRFAWGWVPLFALLVALGRAYRVGCRGVLGRFHEAGDVRCAVEVFAANRRHAAVRAGADATRHEEQMEYFAQQRMRLRNHGSDLDRFERTLARHGGLGQEGGVMGCVFCKIVARRAPAAGRIDWPEAVAFIPLDPVTLGHTLVVPRVHVPDAAADEEVTGATMRRAAELARPLGSFNIITSAGESATQSVFHLHLHVIPRRPGDGLALPWTGQRAGKG